MKRLSTTLFLPIFILASTAFAQQKTKHNKDDKSKDDRIIVLPAFGSSPATGFLFGVVASKNWKTNPDQQTSYSSFSTTLVYTVKKQILFTFKGSLFLPQNKAIIMQDMRYFKSSQPTYGLGTGPQSAKLASSGFEYEDGKFSKGIDASQMIKFNFFRLYETYLKRVGSSNSYAGIGYHLDIHSKIEDQLLNLQSTPPEITSHYAYSYKHGFNQKKYTTSGVSLNYLFDTRDNTVSPYKGIYAFASFKYNPEWLGSAKSSSALWAEFRDYFNISKKRARNLIGVWAYGHFLTSGYLPYMDLPSLGWDQFGRSGRGYPQGRFRGESLVYGEAEWRFPLQRRKEKWGGVVYFNVNSATNYDAKIKMFQYVNKGYGVGLRYLIQEKSRTNICFDFAFGDYGAKGFYLGINEVF